MAKYELSEKERILAEKFIKWHKRCRPKNEKHYAFPIYKIIPNGIGNEIYIKCPYCQKEKDITDIDCW